MLTREACVQGQKAKDRRNSFIRRIAAPLRKIHPRMHMAKDDESGWLCDLGQRKAIDENPRLFDEKPLFGEYIHPDNVVRAKVNISREKRSKFMDRAAVASALIVFLGFLRNTRDLRDFGNLIFDERGNVDAFRILGFVALPLVVFSAAIGWMERRKKTREMDEAQLENDRLTLALYSSFMREQTPESLDRKYEFDLCGHLARPESHQVEFKASLRFNPALAMQSPETRGVDRDLEQRKAKAIASFMNSSGGYLVIGVDDGRKVVGLSGDYGTFGARPDSESFERRLAEIVSERIGPQFVRHITPMFQSYEGQEVCVVAVRRSHMPAFVDKDRFYVRNGTGTDELKGKRRENYVKYHWKYFDKL